MLKYFVTIGIIFSFLSCASNTAQRNNNTPTSDAPNTSQVLHVTLSVNIGYGSSCTGKPFTISLKQYNKTLSAYDVNGHDAINIDMDVNPGTLIIELTEKSSSKVIHQKTLILDKQNDRHKIYLVACE